jgi:large subunit ribosomal protein L6
MSRIGKAPVPLPAGVTVTVAENEVKVAGPKGTLSARTHPMVDVKLADGTVTVARRDDSNEARALHGLTRKLIANMVQGTSAGFKRVLEINGVGYRAEAKGSELHLALGYSHPVIFALPAGVKATVEKQTVITLEGPDRQVLGEAAAAIRKLRPPEPYKGKGIKYAEETIRRKAGKAVGAAS